MKSLKSGAIPSKVRALEKETNTKEAISTMETMMRSS